MTDAAADLVTYVMTAAGLGFFLAGTLGLIRFPDTFSRLHALTKADNIGLGCLIAGIAVQADGWATVAKLALVWGLAMLAAGTVAQLVARAALLRPEPGSGPARPAPARPAPGAAGSRGGS